VPPFLAGRASTGPADRPASRRRPQAQPSKREEWSSQRADLIPSWERERYSAYPTIRTRLGMGDSEALLARLTRILGIVAVVTLVLALLILAPGFFAGAPGPSPTPTATASPSGPTPTPSPSPSPTLSFGSYTVKAGDSLSAIAVELGLLPCQIQAANPEITDPNQIFIGQVLRIPPDDFALDCANPSPSSSP
ncbi:MAG TPA: LysM domain-containing protein, partial [Candidatus Limnocylindrales bacterium]